MPVCKKSYVRLSKNRRKKLNWCLRGKLKRMKQVAKAKKKKQPKNRKHRVPAAKSVRSISEFATNPYSICNMNDHFALSVVTWGEPGKYNTQMAWNGCDSYFSHGSVISPEPPHQSARTQWRRRVQNSKLNPTLNRQKANIRKTIMQWLEM